MRCWRRPPEEAVPGHREGAGDLLDLAHHRARPLHRRLGAGHRSSGHVRGGEFERRQPVRVQPHPHPVVRRPELCRAPHPVEPGQRIHYIRAGCLCTGDRPIGHLGWEALHFLAEERERIMKLSRREAIREVLVGRKLDARISAVKSVAENSLLDIGDSK